MFSISSCEGVHISNNSLVSFECSSPSKLKRSINLLNLKVLNNSKTFFLSHSTTWNFSKSFSIGLFTSILPSSLERYASSLFAVKFSSNFPLTVDSPVSILVYKLSILPYSLIKF